MSLRGSTPSRPLSDRQIAHPLLPDGPAMRPLKIIQENPITVLSVAVLALIGWVAVDLAKTGPKKQTAELSAPVDEMEFQERSAEAAIVIEDDGPMALSTENSVVSSAVLPRVKTGMKRVEVERFLGPPTPDQIHPVTLNNGRMTYSTAYELDDIGPPMTIRPIHTRVRKFPQPPRQPRSLIAFVFDATVPGHPLVDILYADPLF
jgi:hypothetical protein